MAPDDKGSAHPNLSRAAGEAHTEGEVFMRDAIEKRRLEFAFEPPMVPTAWYGGNEHRTAFLSALSLVFPEGERFFVDSVRRYKDRIEDPDLRSAVEAFIGQEAAHGKEHRAFNALLRDRDYPVAAQEEEDLRELLGRAKTTLPARSRLAVTCALEHFTAILAEQLLGDEALPSSFHPSVRGLWVWHALEETEHKAVAFDVYVAIGGGYLRRAAMMATTTAIFLSRIFRIHIAFLRSRGKALELRGWLSLANFLFGWGPGLFRRALPAYLAYYRPGFHPDERDTHALLARWRSALFGAEGELRPWVRADAA